ncbi:hypothetical protein MYA_2956 [Burkholderia sp. KJ006]|nr:hypothetical protein MYA_2956 [Burkholderia sp. KJ006]
MGANDVTKLFRQFDSVAPRRDGELIRRDIRTRARTSRGALRRVLVPPVPTAVAGRRSRTRAAQRCVTSRPVTYTPHCEGSNQRSHI